jgi:hypothetical protein
MDWSHHYNAIAQEQQRGTSNIPDRMPTFDNCKEMIDHGDAIVSSLQRMREMIQQQELHVLDQRMREQGGKGGDYEDEMAMYADDMSKHGFAEGKKQRRGVRPQHSPNNNRVSDIFIESRTTGTMSQLQQSRDT